MICHKIATQSCGQVRKKTPAVMPFIRLMLWSRHELKFNAALCVTIKRDYTRSHSWETFNIIVCIHSFRSPFIESFSSSNRLCGGNVAGWSVNLLILRDQRSQVVRYGNSYNTRQYHSSMPSQFSQFLAFYYCFILSYPSVLLQILLLGHQNYSLNKK